MQILAIVLSATLWSAAIGGPATPRKDVAQPIPDDGNYRLPENIKPISYDIDITTELDPVFTFNGSVLMRINMEKATKEIVFHHRKLNIHEEEITVRDAGFKILNISKTAYAEKVELFVIVMDKELEKGKVYLVEVPYHGELDKNMNGFYKSSYKKGNVTEWMAATQFEATSARMAFPCFDEPAMKATFKISLTHHKSLSAISNMPANEPSKPDKKDMVITTFPETPIMSTYLVAFVLSKYKAINNGKDFEVYAEEEDLDTTAYALTKGKEILRDLQAYLEIDFELPVMKQIPIPDFAAGAMENWGLVTYRETRLLYKEGISTTNDKKAIACVIAHEFGHQWFGNLVSPQWWEYIWLNEGFATFFEYFTASRVERDWRLMEQYVVDTLQSIFVADGLETTRPMNYKVGSPRQIQSIFDGVAYDKAGTVIRMMQHALTDKVFAQGLNRYLTSRNHANANPDHLYDALNFFATAVLPKGVTVKKIMDSWANQKGYPVIFVTRDYENSSVSITQERFLLNRKKDDSEEAYWWIPINYVSQKEPDFRKTEPSAWLGNNNETLTINVTGSKDEWVIFNKQETGYYRVNYDETNWKLITTALQRDELRNRIHPVNRAQLIDDSMNLARSGRLPYATALNLIRHLAKETDYIPWASANAALTHLDRLLQHSKQYGSFQQMVKEAVSGLYKSVGFVKENDTHVDVLARNIALQWSCKLGVSDCRAKSTSMYNGWKTGNAISPDLQKVVYCNVLRDAKNDEEWEYLWEKYTKSQFATEQFLILSVLGCTENEKTLKDYLDKSITADSSIRDQDRGYVMSSVYSSSPVGVKVALEFVENKFFEIKDKYNLANVLTGLSSRLTTNEQKEKFDKMIKDKQSDPKYDDILKIAAEGAQKTINANIEWLNMYEKSITAWLTEHFKGEPDGASAFTGSLVLTVVVCVLAYLV